MKPWKFLCTVSAFTLLGCASPSTRPLPDPLVVASCPDLTPLEDDTFGATTRKLVEVAGLYHQCRAAALGGVSGRH